MRGYIYLIIRIKNNTPCYVGQHICKDKNDNYITSSTLLMKSFRTYGSEWFWKTYKKEILIDNISSKEDLNKLEIEYIRKYNTYNALNKRAYNFTIGGNGGDLGEIVNIKISNTLKNKPKIECLYCKKSFSVCSINRSHNENCLQNPNLTKEKLEALLQIRKNMSEIKLGSNNARYNPNSSSFERERRKRYREEKRLREINIHLK